MAGVCVLPQSLHTNFETLTQIFLYVSVYGNWFSVPHSTWLTQEARPPVPIKYTVWRTSSHGRGSNSVATVIGTEQNKRTQQTTRM